MSFNCEQCGKEILDGDNDDYKGCQHYPVVQLMIKGSRGEYVERKTKNEGYVQPTLVEVFLT